MEVYRKSNVIHPIFKLKNYIVRQILYRNAYIFHKQGLPCQIGRINDYVSINIATEGLYEIEELDLVFDFLSQFNHNFSKQDALDIGANIGNHSLYFSKIFKNVHAFEPNPKTFDILDLNTKEYKNIKRHNFGLSNEQKIASISEYTHNLGRSQVVEKPNNAKSNDIIFRNIELRTLDSLDKNILNNVSLIKIDIEGHELEAIKGAEEFLTAKKPIILFEQLHEEFDEENTTTTIEYLRRIGYKFVVIEKSFSKVPSAILRFLLRAIIKNESYLKQTDHFTARWHRMIIAIDADTNLDIE